LLPLSTMSNHARPTRSRPVAKPLKGTDLCAVRSNLISVTPLCLDFGDQGARQMLDTAFGTETKDG
jgi:broad specificity polyphosphatase/5'/3'-nucleotidase SurE